MSRTAIMLGMALWLTLLGLGLVWATNPMARPPSPEVARITAPQTQAAFLIRLTQLPSGADSTVSKWKAAEMALEGTMPTAKPSFDYESWAFREMRARMIAFILIWSLSGGLIYWVAKQFSKADIQGP